MVLVRLFTNPYNSPLYRRRTRGYSGDMTQELATQMNETGLALGLALAGFCIIGFAIAWCDWRRSLRETRMSQFRITDAVLFGRGADRSKNVAYATIVQMAQDGKPDGRLIFQWRDGSAKLFSQYTGVVISELPTTTQHDSMQDVETMIASLLGAAGLMQIAA
jgi:hypothetical protein